MLKDLKNVEIRTGSGTIKIKCYFLSILNSNFKLLTNNKNCRFKLISQTTFSLSVYPLFNHLFIYKVTTILSSYY